MLRCVGSEDYVSVCKRLATHMTLDVNLDQSAIKPTNSSPSGGVKLMFPRVPVDREMMQRLVGW